MGEPRRPEVKLRVSSVEAARETLRRLGARLVRERHFEDNVLFDDVAGGLRARGTVLRLRRTPHGAVLTFKGRRAIEGGVKSREERETTVGDADEARDPRTSATGALPRTRAPRRGPPGQEVGDETPIGAFLEIEGDVDGIHAVAAELGFSPSDYVSESYVGLFFAGGGKGDMVFP
jgi:adenylate cyclase class 2